MWEMQSSEKIPSDLRGDLNSLPSEIRCVIYFMAAAAAAAVSFPV